MDDREDDFAVALCLPGCPKRDEAEAAVRRALGTRTNFVMEIELFPGRGESLVLAHPAGGQNVYIAEAAVRYLAALYGGDE